MDEESAYYFDGRVGVSGQDVNSRGLGINYFNCLKTHPKLGSNPAYNKLFTMITLAFGVQKMKVQTFGFFLLIGLMGLGPVWAQEELGQMAGELTSTQELKTKTAQGQRYWGSWSLGLNARAMSDLTDSETYASARLNLLGGAKLLPSLELLGDVSVAGASGFSQSRFGNDSLGSGININEALVSVNREGVLSLDAGIVNQRFLGSGLLVSDLPFPGLRQSLKGDWEIVDTKVELGLKAQQAIPTSRTLDNQKRSEKEGTPTFMTQTAYADVEFTKNTSVKASFSRYQFKELPSSVAFESRLLGNTVPFSQASQSRFLFDYQGSLYTLNARQKLISGLTLYGGAELLENDEAPSAYNRGFLTKIGAVWSFLDHELDVSVANYFNESDSSPAFYNSSRLGHNNMKGQAYAAAFTYEELFRVRLQYSDADVISPNLVNTRRQNLSVALETLYVDF